MPFSPLVDFIAQAESTRGVRLSHPGTDYVEVVVPANTTLRWDLNPGDNFYMMYIFRMLIDKSVVPGAFRAIAYVYGTSPLAAVVQGSITEMYMDYFLRITHAQPLRSEITNLTNLNQRWIGATQVLQVSTETEFLELEQKIAAFQGQTQVDTLQRMEEILRSMQTGQGSLQPLQVARR